MEPTWLAGFVDLQVNGYQGINFSSPELTLAQVKAASTALAQRGTLVFCPTVITSSMEVYRHALPVLARAVQLQAGDARLAGIHLEGPFISAVEGAVGVHPAQYVQAPSLSVFDELYRLADGNIALLTLAPEQPGAEALIRYAAGLGVRVSIGHTLADEREVRAAVDAGARFSTHLGNGCPNLLHRHHNPIWPQLAEPQLSAMLISDGHHLPAAVIRAFLAAKGVDRVLVTSDASPVAGCAPGEYSIFGSRVLLEPGGRLRSLERDNLAGSSSTMFECMNYLASLHLLSESELWQVGRDNPLAALGIDPATLALEGTVGFNGEEFQLSGL
jgi:N-acetylglucosamine-6-phosphate deacetylase